MRVEAIGILILLCSPALAANRAEPFIWPTRDTLFTPQLSCAFFFDTAAAQRCDVFGPLTRASELVIRIRGDASVFTFADDTSGAFPRQIVVATCGATGCTKTFPITSTPSAALYLYVTGAPNTVVHASIHSGVDAVLQGAGLDGLL